jgi:hypothetical protein
MARWRKTAIFVSEHYLRRRNKTGLQDTDDGEYDDDNGEDASHLQAGHTTQVGKQHYGIALGDLSEVNTNSMHTFLFVLLEPAP